MFEMRHKYTITGWLLSQIFVNSLWSYGAYQFDIIYHHSYIHFNIYYLTTINITLYYVKILRTVNKYKIYSHNYLKSSGNISNEPLDTIIFQCIQ